MDKLLELRQVTERSGHQGDVKDEYEVILYPGTEQEVAVLRIRHFVEYSIEEVPIQIEKVADAPKGSVEFLTSKIE